MDSDIKLCFSITNTWVMQLAAAIKSVECNLHKNWTATVYILNRDVSPENRQKLEQSINAKRLKIKWLSVSDHFRARIAYVSSEYTEAAFFRLALPDLLADEQIVIYLDADVIIECSLHHLFTLDVRDQLLLASMEFGHDDRYASSKAGIKDYTRYGLKPDARLYNSGVLLMNLEKFRQEQIIERTLEVYNNNWENLKWSEQQALAIACLNKVAHLDPAWNVLTQLFYFNNKAECFLSRKKYFQLVRQPNIIHFNIPCYKPWFFGSTHPFKDRFYYYLDKTLWKGWRPGIKGSEYYLKLPEWDWLKMMFQSLHNLKREFYLYLESPFSPFLVRLLCRLIRKVRNRVSEWLR